MTEKPKTLIFFGPRDDAEMLARKLRNGSNHVLLREASIYLRESEAANRVIVMQSVSRSCEAAIRKLYPHAERLTVEPPKSENQPKRMRELKRNQRNADIGP